MPDGIASVSFSDRLLNRISKLQLLDGRELARARAVADQDGSPVDRALLRLGLMEEAALLPVVCELLGVPLLAEGDDPDAEFARSLSLPYLAARLLVPLISDGAAVRVATTDPANSSLLEEIAFHIDRRVVAVGASTAEVRRLLAALEPKDRPTSDQSHDVQIERDAEALRLAETDGPVIRFVQEKLTDAVLQGASDVHVECTEDGYEVRFRLNGVLVPQRVDH